VLAVIVFRQMVALSERYMEKNAPTFPTPAPATEVTDPSLPHQPTVTVRSG
jgi:hypothetical protein